MGVHEGGYSPLCEGLGALPSKLSLYKKQGGLLQPLPIPLRPWHSVSMKFITNLPRSYVYNAILVMIDRFAKLAHMVLIVRKTTE